MGFELVRRVLVQELVQNVDDGQRRLEIIVQSGVMLYTLPVILQNSIQVHQAIEYKLRVTSHCLNDIKEPIQHILRHFFFLKKIKKTVSIPKECFQEQYAKRTKERVISPKFKIFLDLPAISNGLEACSSDRKVNNFILTILLSKISL